MRVGAVHPHPNGWKASVMNPLARKKLRSGSDMPHVYISADRIRLLLCKSTWSHPLHLKENEGRLSFRLKKIVGSLLRGAPADIIHLRMKQNSLSSSAPCLHPTSLTSSAIQSH